MCLGITLSAVYMVVRPRLILQSLFVIVLELEVLNWVVPFDASEVCHEVYCRPRESLWCNVIVRLTTHYRTSVPASLAATLSTLHRNPFSLISRQNCFTVFLPCWSPYTACLGLITPYFLSGLYTDCGLYILQLSVPHCTTLW